jgi:riboflavin synthase
MFTGIITDIGTVAARQGGIFTIRSAYPAASIALGASIACDGCCLTVTTVRDNESGSIFTLDVSNETLSKTTLDHWQPGQHLNLERALKAGDELGGHIVSGHIDAVARITAITPDGASQRFTIDAPASVARYIAPKGSIALDGTSLTVNDVSGNQFGINLIPHTLTQTTWGRKKPGDAINLEIDLFARYVARYLEPMIGARLMEPSK